MLVLRPLTISLRLLRSLMAMLTFTRMARTHRNKLCVSARTHAYEGIGSVNICMLGAAKTDSHTNLLFFSWTCESQSWLHDPNLPFRTTYCFLQNRGYFRISRCLDVCQETAGTQLSRHASVCAHLKQNHKESFQAMD